MAGSGGRDGPGTGTFRRGDRQPRIHLVKRARRPPADPSGTTPGAGAVTWRSRGGVMHVGNGFRNAGMGSKLRVPPTKADEPGLCGGGARRPGGTVTRSVTMPLSEHEQKMLDGMERQLFADDPRLARAFAPKKDPRNNGRRIAIGLGAVVLGLVVLVLAVALPAVWLGVIV